MKKKNIQSFKFYLLFFLLFLTSSFVFFSLLTFSKNDNTFFQYDSSITITYNVFGVLGAYSSDFLFRSFGVVAYIIPLVCYSWSYRVIKLKRYISWASVATFPMLILIASFLVFNLINDFKVILPYGISGFVGTGLNKFFEFYLNESNQSYTKIFIWFLFIFSSIIVFNLNQKSFISLIRNVNFLFRVLISCLLFLLRFQKKINFKDLLREKKSKKVFSRTKKEKNLFSTNSRKPITNYSFPLLEFLEKPHNQNNVESENLKNAKKNTITLSNVLKDFNIRGNITTVQQGPIVTLYELKPAPGTKTSTVIGLANDIARSMSATSTRISAISGKDGIGIEIPNKQREVVFLKELIDTDEFRKTNYSLPLILGKDILGKAVIVDLAKMPHLLVAGTTGSGKSVGINAMILSLLYNSTPEECRLILIDPKMLELSVYQDIPHLLTEVVTDPKKAVTALKWTVREMESRYQLMTQIGVREIETYNEKVKKILEKGDIIQREIQVGFDSETGKPVTEKKPIDLRIFPKIVVIVDELADLMITSGKEIEAAIQRLSQMARAAGIHLIVATQRPSVDVITGTIKSNFPSRISYQVTSKIDSRTILGEQGGEQLLGKGDLLITMIGKRLLRVHGPFVKTHEVESVVNHIKLQGEPEYLDAITNDQEDNFGIQGLELEKKDELYNKAVSIVCRERRASTSFIQRHLQIGYNRAARIIEKMESEGIISPANHVGRREVLVGKEI